MSEGAFYFELRSQKWPPATSYRLQRMELNGDVANLMCFPDGHLALIIETNEKRKEYHFQRISFQDGVIVKFAFSWSRASAYASAGGESLSMLDESDGRVLELKTKGVVTYQMGQLSVSSETLRNSTRNEALFLETLGDMTAKLASASRYELVRLSALLRQMLCDSPPLALEVNRKYKQTLFFEVAIKSMPPIPHSDSLRTNWRTLYPDSQEEVVSVDLERFLQLITITHDGVACSVHDVIDVVAHAYGGVHHGQLHTNGNRILDALEKEILINDTSVVLLSLQDIGKVTLKTLIPLAHRITEGNGK